MYAAGIPRTETLGSPHFDSDNAGNHSWRAVGERQWHRNPRDPDMGDTKDDANPLQQMLSDGGAANVEDPVTETAPRRWPA